MLKRDSISLWGRRASDAEPAPVHPARDLMLEAAIAHEQVELVYQPVLDAATDRMVGTEVLARSSIARDATSLFRRAQFARLDERLSRIVQRKALRCAAVWEGPLRNLDVSINLLPAEAGRRGYEQWLLEEIETVGIDPKRITLEITEVALLDDFESVGARLSALREAGLKIAVDDLGSGYSSLGYLTTLPLDVVKIDRGLVAKIVRREHDRILLASLIRLAHELGLEVVVEGVESPEQLALLKEWGCDRYQGFLVSEPLSHEELTLFAAT